MDVGFEILIPIEESKSEIQFLQPEFEWEGKLYPQSEPIASFYFFKLIKSPVPPHVLSKLPVSFQSIQWQCISVIDGLNVVRDQLLDLDTDEEDSNKLFNLLTALLKGKSKWIVVFEPDYDQIDEVISGDIDIVFEKIKASISIEKWGFVIWHSDT